MVVFSDSFLFSYIDLQMARFGPSLHNPLNKKVRLAKPDTVYNFERLKTL